MNKTWFIFFLLIISCNRNKAVVTEAQPKIITVKIPKYNYGYDTTEARCKFDLDRAKKDYKNGKLVFSNFGLLVKSRDEIEEILNKKGIGFKPLGENCTGLSNCYGYYMDSILKQKFGKNFFEDLKKEADKLSQSRWKTKVYNYEEVDSPAVYPGTSDVVYLQEITTKMFKRPIGWDSGKMENNESESVSIEIIVDSNGKSIIPEKDYFRYNLKKSNLKHLKYLKKEIRRVVNDLKLWKPAVMNGHKVKSDEYIDVYFN